MTLTSLAPSRSDVRQQSMAVLPTPMISTRSPIESMWPKAIDSSQSMPMWMRSRVVAAGNLQLLAARRAAADEHRVEALARAARACSRPASCSGCRRPCPGWVDLVIEHLGRQAERRDVGAHQAAGLVVLLEDHHLVAERQQVVGDGQRRRARADARDALAVFLCAGFCGSERADVAAMVRRDALQAADGDRLAVEASAPAGRLARPVAGRPRMPGNTFDSRFSM